MIWSKPSHFLKPQLDTIHIIILWQSKFYPFSVDSLANLLIYFKNYKNRNHSIKCSLFCALPTYLYNNLVYEIHLRRLIHVDLQGKTQLF